MVQGRQSDLGGATQCFWALGNNCSKRVLGSKKQVMENTESVYKRRPIGSGRLAEVQSVLKIVSGIV